MNKEESREFCIQLLVAAKSFSIASGQTVAESLLIIIESLAANLDAQILMEGEQKDNEKA